MNPEQIQRLRELEAAASYAPWPDLPYVWADQAKYHNPHNRIMLNSMSSWAVGPQCTSNMQAKHDAELITELRNALPELLDDWERMNDEIGEIRSLLQEKFDGSDSERLWSRIQFWWEVTGQ